jgi:hypothetical protein
MRSSTEVAQRLTVQHRFKFALSVASDTDRLKIANGAGQETAGGFDLSVQQRPRKIATFLIFTGVETVQYQGHYFVEKCLGRFASGAFLTR